MGLSECQQQLDWIRAIYAPELRKPFTPQNPGASFPTIEQDLIAKLQQPADAILLTQSPRQGWSLVPNTRGKIAVLIAVNSLTFAKSTYPGRPPYLAPNGWMGDTATHEVGH